MDMNADKPYSIELAEGAEALGLPDLLKDLIGQNLDQHSKKRTDFFKLKIKIGLIVQDADVSISLDFNKGRLTIYPGILKGIHIVIESESDVIMALSNQSTQWGLPYYFDDVGKEIFSAIKTKRLAVKGMLLHFPSMLRFSRIMSVR
jgi:hypothetical protein